MELDLFEVPEERQAFVTFLLDKYTVFCDTHKKRTRSRRPASEADFARFMGTSATNYSRWINGKEVPNYKNAYIISKKLGDEVFDLLNYEKPQVVTTNKRLSFFVQYFLELPEEDQEEMYQHAVEVINKKYGRGQRKTTGDAGG